MGAEERREKTGGTETAPQGRAREPRRATAASDDVTLAAREHPTATRRDVAFEDTEPDASSRSDPARPEEVQTVPPAFYEMGKEFAHGGLGRILKARDRRLDRVVAIKELINAKPSAAARFEREVRITAKLEHPSIIPIHEAGRWPSGETFYAMKLVDGRSLSDAIAACRGFADRVALLPAVTDVAEAIAYAHSRGIVHRDLKPANVLVGAFGETVVIDWGLAKDLGEADGAPFSEPSVHPPLDAYRTSDGHVLGTPAYMPPEQASGHLVDQTADVYAIGALLYHVLAGHPPYVDRTKGDLVRHVIDGPPTPLSARAPEAPPDLVAIVDKAMARRREDRYADAGEMAAELRRYATGELVAAYRYGSLDLLRRFVRRNRAAVVTAVAALSAFVAFGAVSFRQVRKQRDAAKQSAQQAHHQRQRAERKVEELTVEEAELLLDSDPTTAVLALMTLSGAPEDAASIAARASDRGVARRILREGIDGVRAVAFSPDGSAVAACGNDGRVLVTDARTGRTSTHADHADKVTALAFSPDGRWIASAGHDEVVVLRRVGGSDRRVLRGHHGAVKAVAFSPDSRRAASVADDGSIFVWEVGSEASRRFEAPVGRQVFVEFSPDGRKLLTGAHGTAVVLWDPSTGGSKKLDGHGGTVHAAAFSPDGEIVAVAGLDGAVRLFGAGGTERAVLRGAAGGAGESPEVHAVAFSPDGRSVAFGGIDGRVQLGGVEGGAPRTLSRHAERVERIAFTRDGRWLASAGFDKAVHLHDLGSGDVRVLRGHDDTVSGIAFSPSGRLLASASWDDTVRLWDVPDQGDRKVFRGHGVGVKAVSFSPDGRHLASGAHDNQVRLWDVATGEVRVLRGHTDHVFRVLFSPDDRWVASSSDDRTVRLWPVGGGEPRVLTGHRADVEELAFSPDGKLLASAAEDDTARLWTVATGTSRVLHHRHHVSSVAFSPDGMWLATGSRDAKVRLWHTDTGQLFRELGGHEGAVSQVAFSPDGSTLASVGSDDALRFWHPQSGDSREVAGLGGAHRVAFSPDGKTLAVASTRGVHWMCDATAATCGPPHNRKGSRGNVRDLAYAANGKALVTAESNGTLLVWDVETHERRVLEGHRAAVFDLDVSRDGALVASASGDRTVRLWTVRMPPRPDALRGFLESLTEERPRRP